MLLDSPRNPSAGFHCQEEESRLSLLLGNYSERITESLTNNCPKSSRDIPHAGLKLKRETTVAPILLPNKEKDFVTKTNRVGKS
jgi:hypothetical protein